MYARLNPYLSPVQGYQKKTCWTVFNYLWPDSAASVVLSMYLLLPLHWQLLFPNHSDANIIENLEFRHLATLYFSGSHSWQIDGLFFFSPSLPPKCIDFSFLFWERSVMEHRGCTFTASWERGWSCCWRAGLALGSSLQENREPDQFFSWEEFFPPQCPSLSYFPSPPPPPKFEQCSLCLSFM